MKSVIIANFAEATKTIWNLNKESSLKASYGFGFVRNI